MNSLIPKNKKRGILLAISSGILWGGSGTTAQYLFSYSQLTPYLLTGIRLLFAGLIMLAFCAAIMKENIFKIWQRAWSVKQLLWFSFLGMVPSQLAYFQAIKYGNAATATVIQFLGPLFIIIILAISQHTWPRRVDLISIVVAFWGVFFLVTRGHFDRLALSPLGLVWGLLAALSQAGYTLLPSKLLKNFDTVLVVGWSMLLGSGAFVPCLLQTKVTFTFSSLLAVGYVVIGGTIFSYLFYLQSLRFIDPSIAGMLSAFEPLTAAILSVTLLGLKLNFAEIVGILLVLGTSVLQALPSKRT